ncbi:hypothetical protein BGZ96_001770 [Linnemannia gamsii]|uniref:Serine protease n=1 Tax=Linnemannia gamsii TaxID=64522 RepID=A0ABQ7JLW7_9FUNG|nr:hypothetical protein BGZ96_001770 [Linnemannia gamsii]
MRFASVILLSSAILLFANKNNHQSPAFATAQVSVPGRFRPHLSAYSDSNAGPIPLYKPYLRYSSSSQYQAHDDAQTQGPPATSMPVLQMPHMDNAQLLNDEENARAQLLAGGGVDDGSYRFGKAVFMDAMGHSSTLASGRWTHLKKQRPHHFDDENEEEDVMVWQLEIQSKSALSLNLIFSDFRLPPRAEFYISSRTHLLGAFTAEVNNKADRVFATAPLKGDRLLLELYLPRPDFIQGTRPSLQLSHVIHGYKPTLLAASSDLTAKGLRMGDGSIAPHTRRRRRQSEFREQTSYANPLSTWDQHSVSMGQEEEDGPVRAMSGKCNIDVACHQNEYYDQARSVGAILSEYNQKYCSGALVNNVRQDGRQLFLTANHCSGFADTSAHLVMFNHEKIQCGSSPEDVNEHDTAMGLIKLGSYLDSDYTLYEIVENIPDAYNLFLSGWSASTDAPTSRARFPGQEPEPEPEQPEMPGDDDDEDDDDDEEDVVSPWRTIRRKPRKDPTPTPPPADPSLTKIPVVGIHHPSGDSKKISFFYNGSLPRTCWSECPSKEKLHWQIPRWDQGTTEPGSSGSPLFDADKRIVGQLHGGSASCWNRNGYDVYGAIHASFQMPPKIKDRLSTYLDPEGTGAKFLDGYGMEQARRESRQRHGPKLPPPPTPEPEPPRGDWDEIETWARPGFEKPLMRVDEEESYPDGPSHRGSRYRHPHHPHRPDNPDRLSRFMNRVWQRLAQGYDNNEEDVNEAWPAYVEDRVPCHQSQN